MSEKFFPRAYGLTKQSDIDALYTDWAKTYDAEVTENGYETPTRCAQALRQFLDADAPILDLGCGTGLSGLALAMAGFTDVSGSEVNANMLEQAAKRGIYKNLITASIDTPLPFETGEYAAITAVGVISSGAAPASLLAPTLQKLSAGGLLCLSYNDHTLETPSYTDAITTALDDGIVEQVFCEHGPHLTNLGVGSNVYVLKRV